MAAQKPKPKPKPNKPAKNPKGSVDTVKPPKPPKVFWKTHEAEEIAEAMMPKLLLGATLKNAIILAQDEVFKDRPDRKKPLQTSTSQPLKQVAPILDRMRRDATARRETDRLKEALLKAQGAQKAVDTILAANEGNGSVPENATVQITPGVPRDFPHLTPRMREQLDDARREIRRAEDRTDDDLAARLHQHNARPGWRDIIVDMGREALVAAATDHRFRSAFVGLLSEVVPEVLAEIASVFGLRQPKPEATPPHIVPPKPNMETVAIVGGLPRQWEGIRQLYGKYFDLRFIDPSKPQHYIKGMSRGAAIAYLMTDFIPHGALDAVQAANVPKAFISGSMSALEEVLENRLDRQRRGNGDAR